MMTDYLLLESRIATSVSGFNPQNVFLVTPSSTLKEIVEGLASHVRKRRDTFRTLFISAHGIEIDTHSVDDLLLQSTETAGGYGVRLGKDNLTLANVGEFAKLSGLFTKESRLALRACKIAQESPSTVVMDPERKVLSGNGKLLCLELAAHANAKVLASDAVQHYRLRLGESDVFDTGGTTMRWREDWDGNVFLFDPDTQSVSRAQG